MADLQTPVMQGAYQRHIEELQARIKAERDYLLQSKEENDAIAMEEDHMVVRFCLRACACLRV